jgi:DNA-binding transcriptional LysR family regulator
MIGIPMIDLELLRAFLAVFRHGSVTKAAKALAISQSTMSSRLQTLEQRVGKTLFKRQGRGIRPTADARALARFISPHIDDLEIIFEGFRHRNNGLRGTVRIASGLEFVQQFMLPKLGPLVEMGIRPEFVSGPADERVDALVAGQADLAVLTTSVRHPSIASALMHREKFILVAAPRWVSRIEGGVEASISGGDVPMLAYAQTLPMIRQFWMEVFGSQPLFEPAAVLPDLRSLVSSAAAGIGATVVPDYLCVEQIAAGKLIHLCQKEAQPVNEIHLAWKRSGTQHPRNAIVRDLLLKKSS